MFSARSSMRLNRSVRNSEALKQKNDLPSSFKTPPGWMLVILTDDLHDNDKATAKIRYLAGGSWKNSPNEVTVYAWKQGGTHVEGKEGWVMPWSGRLWFLIPESCPE